MTMKYFRLVCPMCYDEGEIMSCVQREENLVQITYVCAECGYSDKETHCLYRRE